MPTLTQVMQQAIAAFQRGDWGEAERLGRSVLQRKADHFDALNLLGIVAAQTGRTQEAAALFGRAVAANPKDASAHNNLGNMLQELRRPQDALAIFETAIRLKPDHAGAHYNRGVTLTELGRLDEALASFDQAIRLQPGDAEAHVNRGAVLNRLGRLEEALASYDRALARKPDFAEAHYNRGIALKELGRLDDALQSYERALAFKPDHAEAHNNRGIVLQEFKRPDEALASYDRAMAIKPDYAEAHGNRGLALKDLGRLDEALDSYERAIALKPDYAKAYSNRAIALQEFNRLDEALASYEEAIRLEPGNADAHYGRGNALLELNRLDAAVASFAEAIRLDPGHVQAHHSRGIALQGLGRLDEALASFERVAALKADLDYLDGARLHIKMMLCEWGDFASRRSELLEKIARNEKRALPLDVLALTDNPAVQREAAEIWVGDRCPASGALPGIPMRRRAERIRIGYFSSDFRNHPVAFQTAGMFETHDRSRFELTAFSFGPNVADEMTRRLEAAFDRFIDVRSISDRDVALLSRKLEIDIAVDLGGLTQYCRTKIFAMRAAPLQVSYIGYPGTMGAEYIDYLVADRILIPADSQRYYSEKIAYLPRSYQVNDRKRPIADKTFPREELGLPPTGFVFCCFNNSFKISPESFDGWMRILRKVDGGVLWLFEDNAMAARNLCKEAEARGVSAARLVFAKRMPLAEHLARHRAADLFIDTLPYNAHTTAGDALWAGLPLLTCSGGAFASRVAASLLNAIDLPELIAATQEEFEALAIELAANPDRLSRIRAKLEKNRLSTPLFDTERSTRRIEDAYMQMYERHQAGLPPEHIHVEA